MKNNKTPLGSNFDNWLNEELKDSEFKALYVSELSRIDLGQRLKKIAKRRGISIRKLASRMRTSVSQIQRLFGKEAVRCQLDTLIKFSIAVGCSLDEALGTRGGK